MSITGAFGVPEDDDNGRRLVDFYFEKELCVEWVTYFEHKSLRNMAFESVVVPEEWSSDVIVPLYKGQGRRNECKS